MESLPLIYIGWHVWKCQGSKVGFAFWAVDWQKFIHSSSRVVQSVLGFDYELSTERDADKNAIIQT